MNRKVIILIILVILIIAAIAAIIWSIVLDSNISLKLNKKVSKLEENLLNNKNINYNKDSFCVFLSVSDGKNKAYVINKSGNTLKNAIKNAKQEMLQTLKKKNVDPEWVKIDVVNEETTKSINQVYEDISTVGENGYRYGIAFDKNYDIALMESELNANLVINYNKNSISLNNLNTYLKSKNKIAEKQELDKVPDSIVRFSCVGYIYDSTGVYELNSSTEDMGEYGRRADVKLDELKLLEMMEDGSDYLIDAIDENGKYIYRYDADEGKVSDSYNILRHEGTTWSLIEVYKLTKNKELKENIDLAIKYVIDNCVKYKDDDTAYVIEPKNNEIKLGANGIAIVMLTEYIDTFKTNEYDDLLLKLGNGILSMQNDNGSYYHVYEYPEFNEKEKFRTVYYDGEATFALTRIYGHTKDEKWLKKAEKSIDYFIKNNYTQYKDQWIEYSVNEVTKYDLNEKYIKFGLDNGEKNLEKIVADPYDCPVDLELLTTCVEIYDRAIKNNIDTGDFNIKDLISGVHYRADIQLNGLFYPEVCMYFINPERIVGSFYKRDSDFRVRIDDVQHNINGYYNMYRLFKEIEDYSK